MQDIIVSLIIIGILVGATKYLIYQKKNGAKCVGCSSGKSCCASKEIKDKCCKDSGIH